jgi:hypothetical protein
MTARRIDEVRPGHYRYRRVRGGPWLPAVVTVEDGMIYVVEENERLKIAIAAEAYEELVVDSVMAGEAFNSNLLRVIWFGTPITEAEYRQLMHVLTWAREHQPDHPMLHPDKPIQMKEVRVASIF